MAASPYTEAWRGTETAMEMFTTFQTALATFTRYANAHNIPLLIATSYFNQVEARRFWSRTPEENLLAYLKLATMNMKLMGRALSAEIQAMDQFLDMEIQAGLSTLSNGEPKDFYAFVQQMSRLTHQVAYQYPAAIKGIEGEFGFHFERQPKSCRVDETDRFLLYQVLPNDSKVKVRKDGKPILIIPPFVLGANILSFLPAEKRSYAHAYANHGVPTYIRILKDIQSSEAVQLMSPEDDVLDTQRFCKIIKDRHGSPLTLNGYCQGGFNALCNLLSGELDGLVDAFVTCVSPMDGTRSKGLADFLRKLPEVFNDLAYGTKTLANGNKVADGNLMGWIYKLKSIEKETPMLAMWRDMMLLSQSNGDPSNINKTAAALNYWLAYERNDLSLKITRVSFDAYNTPITKDGTLPIKLFGKKLNLKRLQEKKIPWLICYGKQDDLVEPPTALAPLDYVNAEVTGFPKGHVAITTSWSHPDSAYALHLRYPDEGTRGPVRFQLDLQKEIDSRKETPTAKKVKTPTAPASKAARAKGMAVSKPPPKPKAKATRKPKPKAKAKRG